MNENAENCRCRQPHWPLMPLSGNLCEYPHETYIARNYSHWPTFLSPTVWVYLHSIFCGGLRKTYLFCNRVPVGRSRSSKVTDFGTKRKGVCDFILVINSNFGPILHRFWDTATMGWILWIFPTPLSFNALGQDVLFRISGSTFYRQV